MGELVGAHEQVERCPTFERVPKYMLGSTGRCDHVINRATGIRKSRFVHGDPVGDSPLDARAAGSTWSVRRYAHNARS